MTPEEKRICEKIVQKLLDNIKNEGVNDFDNIVYHRSWYQEKK